MTDKPEEKTKSIPHNNKDLTQKYAMSLFKKGSHPMSIFNIETEGVKSVEPTELPLVKDMKIDYLFLMEDNELHHLEFQSNYDKNDLFRFQLYDAMLAYKYKRDISKIQTHIIYPATVKERENDLELEYGVLNYKPNVIFLINRDGDEIVSEIMERIEGKEKPVLSDEEAISLIFSLLMKSEYGLKERASNIFQIIGKLADNEQKMSIVGCVLSLANKALEEKYIKELEEALSGMGQLLENLFNEAEKKVYVRQIEAKLKRDKNIQEIAAELELSVETVESLIEESGLKK